MHLHSLDTGLSVRSWCTRGLTLLRGASPSATHLTRSWVAETWYDDRGSPTREEVVAQVANSQNKCFSWSRGSEESKKGELGKYASPLAAYGKAKDNALEHLHGECLNCVRHSLLNTLLEGVGHLSGVFFFRLPRRHRLNMPSVESSNFLYNLFVEPEKHHNICAHVAT